MSSSLIESADPSRRQLVSFGFTIGGALVVLAAIRAWRRGIDETVIAVVIVAALFALSALTAPNALSAVYRWWMRLAEILGWINTRIILLVIFYLVVTPLGLIMRAIRKSPLDQGERDSYWTEAPQSSYGDKHYEKQF